MSKIYASGCLLLAKQTQRILLQQRAQGKFIGHWGFFGGKAEPGELPSHTLYRELMEELGTLPAIQKLYPLHKFVSPDKRFEFTTFIGIVENEFTPNTNNETLAYAWCNTKYLPQPLHPGVRAQLTNTDINKKLVSVLEHTD